MTNVKRFPVKASVTTSGLDITSEAEAKAVIFVRSGTQ